MSAKEKYLRKLLIDAEFYLKNIDNDDPTDLVADALNSGRGKHPVDAAVRQIGGAEENKNKDEVSP